jgi:hypothetical protein
MARCPGPIGELRYRMQDVQQGKRPAGSGENSTDSAGLAVELWGFEPQTSSMPWKRATNCAIAPWVITHSTRSPGVVGTSCSRRGGTGPLSPRLEGRKPRWTRVAVQLDRAWALPHPFKKPLSHTGEWRSSLSPTPMVGALLPTAQQPSPSPPRVWGSSRRQRGGGTRCAGRCAVV